MTARFVLILQHIAVEKPGLIAEVLDGCPMRIESPLQQADISAVELPAVDELAGLVVMGGPMNADAVDEYPGLKLERDLLAAAVEARVPTLGICLGAQLLARAVDLAVLPGSGTEIGWAPLADVDADDPVVGPLAQAPAVLHWHGDRIVAASGTPVLARTEITPCQAFRIGPSAWGLQFHPEVTPALLDDWLTEPSFVAEAERALGPGALARLRADARTIAPGLRPLAERGLRHFRSLIEARL
ncbi:type 1 glutamine amidotransferase [Nocardia sp. NPDC051570]|uniref:type 1 glutamine amidotransferase n=1 Tax=Nocardia sp. NPDC051570 TaxID=3364324 RepID=UPI0037BC97FF